jgi:hypothetical protein
MAAALKTINQREAKARAQDIGQEKHRRRQWNVSRRLDWRRREAGESGSDRRLIVFGIDWRDYPHAAICDNDERLEVGETPSVEYLGWAADNFETFGRVSQIFLRMRALPVDEQQNVRLVTSEVSGPSLECANKRGGGGWRQPASKNQNRSPASLSVKRIE